MHIAHTLFLKIHILIGAMALLAFWLPIATRKGSALHIQAGRVYVYCMYAVSLSALTLSILMLIDPIGIRFPQNNLDPARASNIATESRQISLFLSMLGLLVLTGLRHGLLALKTKTDTGALRSHLHRTLIVSLGVAGTLVFAVGLRTSHLLLILFSVLSITSSVSMWREASKPALTHTERITAHIGGLVGTGIGAYTAFFAFGSARLLSDILTGQWQIVPWILPTIVGTVVIRIFGRRYQQRSTA